MNAVVQMTWVRALLDDLVKQATDSTVVGPGKLSGAKVDLFSNLITPAVTTLFSDLTRCVYTGNGESAVVVWDLPINEVDGTPTVWGAAHLFRMTGDTDTDVCNGICVTDGVASPNQGLLMLGVLPNPFSFGETGDGFTAQIAFNPGQPTANCQAVVVNS